MSDQAQQIQIRIRETADAALSSSDVRQEPIFLVIPDDALLVDFLIGKTLNDDVANADDTFALPKGTEITREIALDAKKHDALLLLTMSVD